MKKSLRIFQIPPSKNIRYFGLFFVISFVLQAITAIIANYFNFSLTTNSPEFNSLTEELILVVIAAPIFETLIFQYLIIETLLNLKLSTWLCIIFSALAFGASHWYNPLYIAATTLFGFIFAYYYIALRHQNGINKIAFLILLHALYNAIVFMGRYIDSLS